MSPVKSSKITINQFPIFDHLFEQLKDQGDVVGLSNKEVIELFLKVVDTTVQKSLQVAGIDLKVTSDTVFYTSEPSPLGIPDDHPIKKNKKVIGYKWEATSRFKVGVKPIHVSWHATSMVDEDDHYAAFYLYDQRTSHQYFPAVARNLLQSFISFLQGEKNFNEMWALGLIDPCAFSIASSVNTYNRMVSANA
jgi:hypothetical protein